MAGEQRHAAEYAVVISDHVVVVVVGAVGLNRIGRFRLDPRDARADSDYYELVGDDDGIFGCMSLLACHDVCPKDLPLQQQIAFVRRKMVMEGLK